MSRVCLWPGCAERSCYPSAEKFFDLSEGFGAAEQKTLHLIASLGSQKVELTCRFDAFRRDLEPEAMSHRDDRDRDRGVVFIGGNFTDEGGADFE